MRVISGIGVVMLSIVLLAGHAYSQTVKRSTLTGEIRSASASVPFGASGSLLLVPENRFYVLTQACLLNEFGAGKLGGTDIGVVVAPNGCTTYTPGITFQPGEEIIFTVDQLFPGQTGSLTATVTGVLIDPNDKDH